MKHLIVAAHPVKESLTMGITTAYVSELESLGHEQRTYDLYRMGFNPVLAARELSSLGDHEPISADVSAAQEDIRAAEVLTVIYPLWWLSMPAIMKGYIDRVFARGFAYDSHRGIVRGLLAGKKAVLITLSGAPLPLMVAAGNWNAVQVLQDTHMFRAAGFEILEHLHFDEIAPGLSSAVAAQHIEGVRACARKHFSRH